MEATLPYYIILLISLSTLDIRHVIGTTNDPCDVTTFTKLSVNNRRMVVNYKIWQESNTEMRRFQFIPLNLSNLVDLSLRGGFPSTSKPYNAYMQFSNYNSTVFNRHKCNLYVYYLVQSIEVNRALYVDMRFDYQFDQIDLILDVQMGNGSNFFHRSYPILSEANAQPYILCQSIVDIHMLQASDVNYEEYPFEIIAIKTDDVLNIHFIQVFGRINALVVHIVDSDSNIIGGIRSAINDLGRLCSNELNLIVGDESDISYEIIEWKPNVTFTGEIFLDTAASQAGIQVYRMTNHSLGFYEFLDSATTDNADELSSTESDFPITLDDITQSTTDSSLTSGVTSEGSQVTDASETPEITNSWQISTKSEEDSSMMTSPEYSTIPVTTFHPITVASGSIIIINLWVVCFAALMLHYHPLRLFIV